MAHIQERVSLYIPTHDFVTAIVFHPKDDQYFLSGSFDGKLRLWNIPEKKVIMWNEYSSLITKANFCHNVKFVVAGTYDGKCIFYTTEILMTSNDSRIRLYDHRDLTLICKYKGCTNTSSQIKAIFSPKSKHLICGSEYHFVYTWKTHHEFNKFSFARRDRNDYWETIKVTMLQLQLLYLPQTGHSLFVARDENQTPAKKIEDTLRQVIVTADFTGAIKVVLNLGPKPT